MALRFDDRWVWDFWLAQKGEKIHIFYLQADKSIGDPNQRHYHTSVGHAVSRDLVTWDRLPDALVPSAQPAFDDMATWTGSIIAHDGSWYMFYTGLSHADKGLVQRIGLAMSHDLMTWQKHPDNPLIKLDSTWYETLDTDQWPSEAWRDPYLFVHPDTGEFHAFITARTTQGESLTRGTIGHAVSSNLLDWQVRPPLTVPRQFGHLEVPQVIYQSNQYFLLFSVDHKRKHDHDTTPTNSGIYYMTADDILGPYSAPQTLLADAYNTHYSGRLFQKRDGNWVLMAALFDREDGHYVGEIADPIPVQLIDNRIILVNEGSTP